VRNSEVARKARRALRLKLIVWLAGAQPDTVGVRRLKAAASAGLRG
jgi:hypothetical protein